MKIVLTIIIILLVLASLVCAICCAIMSGNCAVEEDQAYFAAMAQLKAATPGHAPGSSDNENNEKGKNENGNCNDRK